MADPMNLLPSPMRSFAWRSIVVVFGVSLVTVMATVSYLSADFPKKTISAGRIEWTPVTPSAANSPAEARIKGSFTISSIPPGQENAEAIPSNGTGGACLVAEWGRFGLGDAPSCSKNSDCMNALPPDKRGDIPTNTIKWFGYCHEGEGKCWLRPGGVELCNRSPDYDPLRRWDDGTYDTPKETYYVPAPPGSGSGRPVHTVYPRPITWRVVACLNQIDPATGNDSKGCGAGGPLRKQVFGTPKRVPHGLIVE